MDKLRKVGLSALAGSLAMFSANADVALTGSGEFTSQPLAEQQMTLVTHLVYLTLYQ